MLVFPAVSLAEPATDDAATAIHVSYKDLDVRGHKGAHALLIRIDRAALEACGASEFSALEYIRVTKASSCYRDGVRHAVQAVGSAALDSEYQAAVNAAGY